MSPSTESGRDVLYEVDIRLLTFRSRQETVSAHEDCEPGAHLLWQMRERNMLAAGRRAMPAG